MRRLVQSDTSCPARYGHIYEEVASPYKDILRVLDICVLERKRYSAHIHHVQARPTAED